MTTGTAGGRIAARMPTPGGKAGKLLETLLPAVLAVVALLLAAPPRDAGAEAQYDRAAAASCSGHAGYADEATAVPYQYCPGRAGAGVRPYDDYGYPRQPQYPQDPPPSQYPPPEPELAGVVVDVDEDGRPETNVTVADSDGDGVVDEEDVSAVVGDVFFVYAADGASSVGSATPNATPEASGEGDDVAFTPDASGEGGAASSPDEIEDGESRPETTAGDADEDASGEVTRGPGEETVGDAERAAASGEPPGGRGPGRIALFALGAGTLLVANGLLARWIVG